MTESKIQQEVTINQSTNVPNSIDSLLSTNFLLGQSNELIDKWIELGTVNKNETKESVDVMHKAKKPVIIVLTSNIDQSDLDFEELNEQLQSISSSIDWYTDKDQCIDSLTDMNDVHALMIIYNYSDLDIISLINFIPQIHVIYLFHHNHHQLNNDNYAIGTWNKKVKSVYHHIEQMCYILKQEFYQLSTYSSFTFLSSNSNFSFDELDSSFMYTQLFKEILMEIKYDKNKAKTDFIKYCRDLSTSIDFKSKDIDQFEKEYHENNAIWWYTKASFLYSNVNKALRSQDMKVLMKMAFFLQDLHHHIEKRYLEDNHQSKVIVYRGQGLFNRKFEELKKSKGALFSFNCFLSTSMDRNVAYMLADSIRSQNDMTGIIFRIEIDPVVSPVSFISVEKLGNYLEEQEILFSMHSVFRIGNMEEIEERLWLVNLTITNENDTDLKNLTDFLRKEINFAEGWFRMAFFMERIGNFDGALEIYVNLFDATNDDDKQSQLVAQITIGQAIIDSYLIKGEYALARDFYQHLLNFWLHHLPSDDLLIGFFYQKLGLIHAATGEYSASLENYDKALKLFQKNVPADHRFFGIMYHCIATTQYQMGDFASALINYQKTLQILEKCLPHNHPDLGQIYTNLSSLYHAVEEYSTALSYTQKALEIQKRTLPLGHPSLGVTYNSIALSHLSMGNFLLAHSNLQTSCEILENSQFSNNPIMIKIYNNIGFVQKSLHNYQDALLYFEKAFMIANKSLPSDHIDVASSHVNIGMIKSEMGDYPTAVEYLKKALKIYEKIHLLDHPEHGRAYLIMGSVYHRKGDFSMALVYLEKAFVILKQSVSAIHPLIAVTYRELGSVQQSLGNLSLALSHYEGALRIQKQCFADHHPELLSTYQCITVLKALTTDFNGLTQANKNMLQVQQTTFALNNQSLDDERNVTKRMIGQLEQKYSTISQDWENFTVNMKNYETRTPFQNNFDYRTEIDLCEMFNTGCQTNEILEQQIKLGPKLRSNGVLPPLINNSDHQLFLEKSMEINKQNKMFHIKLQNYHLASQNSLNGDLKTIYLNDLKEYVLQSCESSINFLDIWQRLLPPNDVSLAMEYNQVGIDLCTVREYEKALIVFEKVRDMLLQSCPVNHQYLAHTYNSIALILYAVERYQEAFDSARGSVKSAIIAFGSDHPKTRAYEEQLHHIEQTLSS